MRLEQLQYFAQIVECRSFNKAAQKLFITQPALTNSMNQLEEELQIKLLVRTNRGVTPTSFGMRVYEDCKDIIDELNRKIALWKSLTYQESTPKEVIHLLGIPFSCTYFIEEVIPVMKKKMSDVDFIVQEAFHDNIYECLKGGNVHISITFIIEKYKNATLNMYKNIKFNAEKLLDDEYAVFISTRSELAEKEKLTVEDCRKLLFATYSVEYDKRCVVFRNIKNILGLKNYEYLNSRESIMQKIAENSCAGLFLKKMSKNNWYLQNNLICAKEVEGVSLLPSQHYLLWLEDSALTEAERAVVRYIREGYASFFASETTALP